MIREIGAATDAQALGIGVMLFFITIFTAVAVWVLTKKRGHYTPHAQLPLDDAEPTPVARPRARAEQGR